MSKNNSVKQLWQEHWHNKSTLEDSSSPLGNFLRQRRLHIVQNILKKINTSYSILDMGCGGGTTLTTIKGAGYENVTGIDFSSKSILHCKSLGLKNVHIMDARNTKFPNNSFDIVFSEGLWEHFEDPRPYMAEAARLAKKYIIVVQPDHFSFFGRLMHIGWNFLSKKKGGVYEYSFLLSYFKDFLKLYGFELITSKSTILHEQVVMVFKKCSQMYNINGLKVQMFTDKPYQELEPYRNNNLQNFDLVFYIGHVPKTAEDNSIYSKYKHKLSYWEAKFHNFGNGRMIVHFKGDPFFSRHLFFTMIFEPLLQYKQTQKKHLVLHASAIANNNKSYAFVGDASVGKTSTLIHFLSKGFQYLADDQVTIDTKTFKIHPYTLPIGVNIKLALKTQLSLSMRNKLSLLFQTLVNTIFLNYTHLTTSIQVQDLIFENKKSKLGKLTKLDKIFILKDGPLSITKLSSEEAFNELWKDKYGSQSKLPALIYYGREFKKKNPNFLLWKDYQKLLSKLVTKVPIYKISFTKQHFQEAIKLIEKEIWR